MFVNKKAKVVTVLLIPVLVLGYLAFLGFKDSAAYYYSLAEVSALPNRENKLRVKGKLVAESVHYNAQLPLLEFTLAEGEHRLRALYEGVLPDNFGHADWVIAEGKLGENGQFLVSKLMLQCPSKYEDGE